jgi:hypothetical protein
MRQMVDQVHQLLSQRPHVQHGDAEQHGEEQDLQDVARRERVDDRRRDDVHQEVGDRQVGGARRIRGDGGGIELRRVRVDALAGLHDVHEHEADEERHCRDDLEVDERAQADAADLLHVAHLRDADDDRAENDRRNHHPYQLDEGVAERLHRRAASGIEIAQQNPRDDADNHLEPEPRI